MDSISCWLRWEKRLKELMKRERLKVLGSKWKELRTVAGKAQSGDPAGRGWTEPKLGEEEPVCGAGGWWQEAEEVWRKAESSSESQGEQDQRLAVSCRAASAPPGIPLCLSPQARRVQVSTCAFIFKLHPSIATCHSSPFISLPATQTPFIFHQKFHSSI